MSETPRFESKPRTPIEEQKIEAKVSQELVESDTINKLRVKMGSLSEQPGLAQSLGFINSLPKEEQSRILEVFSDKDKEDKLAIYIDKNGFPNGETYLNFKKRFQITKEAGEKSNVERIEEKTEQTKEKTEQTKEKTEQTKEKTEQTKEKTEQTKEKIEQIKEFNEKTKEKTEQTKEFNEKTKEKTEQTKEFNEKNITLLKNIEASFQGNIGKIKDTEVRELLIGISKLNGDLANPQNKELFESISKKILEKNGLLEKTLQEGLKIDRENAQNGVKTNVFQGMSQAFSSFDPSLNARIEKFKLENDVGTLQTAQINATLGTNSDKQYAGDFVYNKDKVAIDLSKTPPEAFMSSEGGYRLPLDMPVGEFYPATVKYEKARQNLEPQIKGLDGAIDYLNSINGITELTPTQKEVIRGQLGDKLFRELQIDSIKSIKEVGKKLTDKREILINELQVAKQTYQTDLKRISEVYAKSQQEKKDVMKSSLDFISSIGFDVVPQYITDMILGEINRGELGVIVNEPIDIANGNFGIKNADKKRIITDEKQAFIKLVNKMFSGNEQEPISILEHSGETNVPVDKMKLKEQLAKYGVFPNKEKWDINKIRENLRKQPITDTPKTPS